MKTTTQTSSKPTAEQIDLYLAAQYIARHSAGTQTAQLLMMAEDAAGNEATRGSAGILRDAARRMAEWELENA